MEDQASSSSWEGSRQQWLWAGRTGTAAGQEAPVLLTRRPRGHLLKAQLLQLSQRRRPLLHRTGPCPQLDGTAGAAGSPPCGVGFSRRLGCVPVQAGALELPRPRAQSWTPWPRSRGQPSLLTRGPAPDQVIGGSGLPQPPAFFPGSSPGQSVLCVLCRHPVGGLNRRPSPCGLSSAAELCGGPCPAAQDVHRAQAVSSGAPIQPSRTGLAEVVLGLTPGVWR